MQKLHKKVHSSHPIIDVLARAFYRETGDKAVALQIYHDALNYRAYRALVYGVC